MDATKLSIKDKNYVGNFRGQDLWYSVETYETNGRPALLLMTADTGPYACVSINLPDIACNDNMFYVSNDVPKELVNYLEVKHIIGEPLWTAKYNLGEYELRELFVNEKVST